MNESTKYDTYNFDFNKIKEYCESIENTNIQIDYIKWVLTEYKIAGSPKKEKRVSSRKNPKRWLDGYIDHEPSHIAREYTIDPFVDDINIEIEFLEGRKERENEEIKLLEERREKEIDINKDVFDDAKSEINSEHTSKILSNNMELDKSKVLIVHGHDDLAKTEAARFIEQLELEAIILDEQPSSGKTIIEKIEEYSNVGFGIVLYTPCDIGSKKNDENNLKSRARQNVILEHGYLMGKIGRNNVCVLFKDKVEKPSDISGVIYVEMDDQKAWRFKVAKEMKNSGYKIDMNLIK